MLAKHSIIYILLKGGASIFGFLTILVFTRLLTPEEYGVYAMLISAMSVVYAVFFQWLSLSVGRFYVENSANSSKFLSTISLGFIISVFISSVLLFFGFLIFKNYSWGKWIFILPFLAWSYAWYDLNLRVANASLKPMLYGMLSLTKAFSGLILGILLCVVFGLYGIFAGLIISALLVPIIFMRSTWISSSYFNIDKALFKKLLTYGLPLAATALLTLVVDVSDRFIIAGILGKEQAGLYSASYDLLVQIIGFVFMVFYLVFFPIIIKYISLNNYEKAKLGYRQYGITLFACSLPLVAVFISMPHEIADIFFGVAFRSSATELIPIIALGMFLGSFKIHFFDLAFQFRNKTLKQIFPALLTAIVNILLNIIWIPIFGINGAAYASFAAFLIGLLASAVMVRDVVDILSLTVDIFKIVMAAIAMVLLFLLLASFKSWYFFSIKVIVGLALYVGLLFALNVTELKKLILRDQSS